MITITAGSEFLFDEHMSEWQTNVQPSLEQLRGTNQSIVWVTCGLIK